MEWLKRLWCNIAHIEYWEVVWGYSNRTSHWKCRKCQREFDA